MGESRECIAHLHRPWRTGRQVGTIFAARLLKQLFSIFCRTAGCYSACLSFTARNARDLRLCRSYLQRHRVHWGQRGRIPSPTPGHRSRSHGSRHAARLGLPRSATCLLFPYPMRRSGGFAWRARCPARLSWSDISSRDSTSCSKQQGRSCGGWQKIPVGRAVRVLRPSRGRAGRSGCLQIAQEGDSRTDPN